MYRSRIIYRVCIYLLSGLYNYFMDLEREERQKAMEEAQVAEQQGKAAQAASEGAQGAGGLQ